MVLGLGGCRHEWVGNELSFSWVVVTYPQQQAGLYTLPCVSGLGACARVVSVWAGKANQFALLYIPTEPGVR
jgi:hypothetical protein